MGDLTLEQLLDILVCPDCNSEIHQGNDDLRCRSCDAFFPIVSEIPILLSQNSIFTPEQVALTKKTYYADSAAEAQTSNLKRNLRKRLPRITKSWERNRFYALINRELNSVERPTGLQLGAGEVPSAIKEKIGDVRWAHSDVDLTFGPDIIADASGLPFRDESFDLVFADNVLEHVFDLPSCVSEIQRVTKIGGLVVVCMPFMYPFHGVPYDFTRLTPCGLRAAFTQTESLFFSRDSGAFVALALQLDSRLINLFGDRQLRSGSMLLSRFLFSGFKYLDRLSSGRRHLNTATSFLYVGRKTDEVLSNKEIMSELRRAFVDLT